VKSSLQRARGRLRELSLAADDIAEPASPGARAVLDQYMAAFHDADPSALQRLLRHDAQMEATPIRGWFAGSKTCVPFLRSWVLGTPGDWQMLPTSANGQPAAVGYRRGADGARHAYGVVVLTVTGSRISHIVSFGEPALAPLFGFPSTLPAS
jgi:RNA polymerase sigma-70 factor (ECF subfamily)